MLQMGLPGGPELLILFILFAILAIGLLAVILVVGAVAVFLFGVPAFLAARLGRDSGQTTQERGAAGPPDESAEVTSDAESDRAESDVESDRAESDGESGRTESDSEDEDTAR